MTFYRRRLPHIHELNRPIWRLKGSFPPNRRFTPETLTTKKSFLTIDRPVDEAQTAFQKIQPYIEQNPVKARLATNPTDYKYSSAPLQR